MSFGDFLAFLAGPGVNAAIGFILSFVIEYFPEWEALDARVKRFAVLGLCFVIPLLATLIGVLAGYMPPGFEASWWPALVAGAAAFGASTVAHVRKLA